MKFTKEQIKTIDKMQRKTGNKLYTIEKVWGTVFEQYHKDLQNCNPQESTNRYNR